MPQTTQNNTAGGNEMMGGRPVELLRVTVTTQNEKSDNKN